MIIDRLLEGPHTAFMEQVYTRLPYARPGGARDFVPLATWETLRAILLKPGADVMLSRDGRLSDFQGTPTCDDARRHFADGFTITVRNAERHDDGLARLAADFHADFAAPVDVHLYFTPPGRTGFGWHYDAEDVFILQTAGRKRYTLRRNTVNPWPLRETLPRDMRYEAEVSPGMECLLAPGDWLYIPPGTWHIARAEEESITLAVGMMTPAAIAVYDFLRAQLLSNVLWRQRLPVTGAASPVSGDELVERYRQVFADLGKDLARTFEDVQLARDFLRRV